MNQFASKALSALDNVGHWLLSSSSNPEAASLTVKGALLGAVPALMYVFGIAHIGLGQDQLTSIFDGATATLQAVLTVIATSITLFGALRKAWNTVFPSAQG